MHFWSHFWIIFEQFLKILKVIFTFFAHFWTIFDHFKGHFCIFWVIFIATPKNSNPFIILRLISPKILLSSRRLLIATPKISYPFIILRLISPKNLLSSRRLLIATPQVWKKRFLLLFWKKIDQISSCFFKNFIKHETKYRFFYLLFSSLFRKISEKHGGKIT